MALTRLLGMLPQSPEAKIYRAICDYFDSERARNGSGLFLAGATIWSWKGDPTQVADLQSEGNLPSFGQLPLLRINPVSLPMAWQTEQQHRGDWVYQFEMFTPGTCVDDLMDFAGVVRSVLFPTDPTLKAAVKAALTFGELVRPKWSQQMGGVAPLGADRRGMRATASLGIAIHVNTW